MPPVFNPNAAEVVIKYSSMGKIHRSSFHFANNLTGGEMANFAAAFASVHRGYMRIADAVLSIEQKQKGANFTIPYPFTPIQGTVANDAVWENDPDSVMISLVGRSSSSGQRCRHIFFSPCKIGPWPDDNRYRSGELPAATDMIGYFIEFLNAEIEDTPYPEPSCKDGTDANWYPYLNFSHSGYWERKQRT